MGSVRGSSLDRLQDLRKIDQAIGIGNRLAKVSARDRALPVQRKNETRSRRPQGRYLLRVAAPALAESSFCRQKT
jgi:hypothetical protein